MAFNGIFNGGLMVIKSGDEITDWIWDFNGCWVFMG